MCNKPIKEYKNKKYATEVKYIKDQSNIRIGEEVKAEDEKQLKKFRINK